jgi:hypothetical protein
MRRVPYFDVLLAGAGRTVDGGRPDPEFLYSDAGEYRGGSGAFERNGDDGNAVQGTGFGMPFYIEGELFGNPSDRPGAGSRC